MENTLKNRKERFNELNSKYENLMRTATKLIGTDIMAPMSDLEEKELRGVYYQIDLIADQIIEEFGYDEWFTKSLKEVG